MPPRNRFKRSGSIAGVGGPGPERAEEKAPGAEAPPSSTEAIAPRDEPEPAAPPPLESSTAIAPAPEVRPENSKPVAVASVPTQPHLEWLWALILVAATILAYQQVWRAGFIWDDDMYVTANPLLTAADGLKRIWFSLDSPSQYFPLVYTSFRFEHALWGLNPAGYHWVNIVLHAANALLVWRLLRMLRIPGALIAAALFALHPVQVESVAWITERKNVLMGFFFLLALICWVRFIAEETKGKWSFYAAALLLYVLALFSKTTACTLPAALLLTLWLRRQPINFARLIQIAPFVIFGLAMGAVSIWWERVHQGTHGQFFSVAFPDRILIASRAVWFYLGKLIWPADLAFSYPRWPISSANLPDYTWLGLIVLGALVIWWARRFFGRSVEVALLFFVATLAPMLGLVMLYTFRFSWVADHYQYLACIGPFALVGAALALAQKSLGRNYIVLAGSAVAAAFLLSLGIRTWKQGAAYHDPQALWRATIAANPGSWMAYNNLAIQELEAGRIEDALPHYRKSIELNPDYAEAHYNLGNALARTGRLGEAAESYANALTAYPRFALAHSNLAVTLFELGRGEEAITHLREAVALDPQAALAQQSLGNALIRNGNVTDGIKHLKQAMVLDPALPRIDRDLALASMKSGTAEEVLEYWKRAAERDPADALAQTTVGTTLAQSGRLEESLPYFRKAVEIEPTNAEAHYNFATSLSRSQRFEEAIAEYREALRIKPDYAAAHVNLANSFLQSDRPEEAVAEYNLALQLNPNSVAAHKNLANVLRRLGKADEADAHLESAAAIESAAQSAP